MRNKYLRYFLIVFGGVLLIIIITIFGVNYWLKKNLPDYLKNNSTYTITYKKLEVDLISGNITAQGINIKNIKENKILGLQGTIDSLNISRLGIYDIIFNKTIHSKNIVLVKPNLIIQLPIKNNKTQNNKYPIEIKNINIRNGNIQILKPDKRKIVGINNLDLKISGFEPYKKNDKNELPFRFDHYSIEAEKVFFRYNNIYLLLTDHIKTENDILNIQNIKLIPLLNFSQFTKYFPEKKSLINLKSSEAFVEGFTFNDQKISLRSFRLENPNLKINTSHVKPSKKNKIVKNNFSLGKLIINNAKINILKPNLTPLLLTENLNIKLDNITLNSETVKKTIPFQYQNYNLDIKNVKYFSPLETLKIASAKATSKRITLHKINLKSKESLKEKNYFDLNTKFISIQLNNWEMVNSKLKMEMEDVLVDKMAGKIRLAETKNKKTKNDSFLDFPLKIQKINLKDSTLDLITKGKPMILNGLNFSLDALEINQNEAKQISIKSSNYNFTLDNFNYNPNKFYKISAKNINFSEKDGQISNFALIPLVSKAQFIKMIPKEKDLYNLKAQSIIFKGKYDLINQKKIIHLSNLTLNKVVANIYRSKIPKDDETVKSLYSKMLRSIKFPVYIQNLDMKNSILLYEEDIPTSDGPGKLLFSPFNMNVQNLNSAKMKGKPTNVAITVNAGLMGNSPLNILWGFNVADVQDRFTIAGTAKNLPAHRINPFIEPYLHVKASGLVKELSFNLNGDPTQISGVLKMQHDHLKISILKKNSKEKNKFLSGIANLIIKNNSDKFPTSVNIKNVERDNTKSFFNLLWKGLQDGLAQTLIDVDYKEKIKKLEKTVNQTKEALEKVNSKKKKEIKNKTDKLKSEVKKEEPKKKKGFLNRIFR